MKILGLKQAKKLLSKSADGWIRVEDGGPPASWSVASREVLIYGPTLGRNVACYNYPTDKWVIAPYDDYETKYIEIEPQQVTLWTLIPSVPKKANANES